MTQYKIDFNPIEWEKPYKGIKFKKFISGNKQIRFVEYTKDFIELDWCSKGHIGYVIKGKIKIDFNGKIVYYKAGDNIFIPSGDTHKHKAIIISDIAKVFLVEDI